MNRRILIAAGLLAASLPASFQRFRSSPPQPKESIMIFGSRESLGRGLRWFEMGPVNHSGRVVDIAVHPKEKGTFYVAAATGGIWKTTDHGLHFESIFAREDVFSIGDIALDPNEPETIWVGTGEANNQRSSYWGNGVYKSTDGGKTWKNMGLRESHHIGRVLVDPTNGDRVFVAVLGRLYTPSAERGLYLTEDGGKTWRAVLKISEDVGVVDVAMQPGRPKVMLAAAYERRRRAWNFDGAGPGSGVYRSTDGGLHWKRVTKGLPSGEIGRIGIAFSASSPRTVYLTLSNQNPSKVTRRRIVEPGSGEEGEAEAQRRVRGSGMRGGEVYKSMDGGLSWKKVNRRPVGGRPPYYYGQIRVAPGNPDLVWVLSVPLYYSKDGGKNFSNRGATGVHLDNHALWIDPDDNDHLLLGNDGGLCESWDRGKHWIHFENLPIGQFYAVTTDTAEPYRIYGGTQDNGTWGIPSRGPTSRGKRLQDSFKVAGGDGFHVQVDPKDPNTVYAESQFGGLVRVDLRTMRVRSIRPRPGKGESKHRFNWMSPLKISRHNHEILYFGGERLFRSLDQGDRWQAISPDLTTKDPRKIAGNVPHCTITTISESPLRFGLIWVGTDDGKLWMTPDGGKTWRDLTGALPAEARGLWISRVEASRFFEGRCYVSVTGYREDLFRPMVYMTGDYGLTFRSIAGDLPPGGPVNVVREDPVDEDLIFAGTEFGVFFSLTRGGRWHRLGKGLSTVAVHDLTIQAKARELVAATHGRGIWMLPLSALEAWKDEAEPSKPAILAAPPVWRFPSGPSTGYTSPSRILTIPNPVGTDLAIEMPKGLSKASLRILDARGRKVRDFDLPSGGGLYLLHWNGGGTPTSGGRGRGFFGRIARGFRRFTGRMRSRPLPEGVYRLEVRAGGKTLASGSVEIR